MADDTGPIMLEVEYEVEIPLYIDNIDGSSVSEEFFKSALIAYKEWISTGKDMKDINIITNGMLRQ